MRDEDAEEILDALGLDGETDLAASPEARFEHRLLSAVVDARREDVDYWRLFELLERYQRAAVRAAFRSGEFGSEYVGTVDQDTVQYSQVVHATAQAMTDGAEKRDVLVNLASAYRLFEREWTGEGWSTGGSAVAPDGVARGRGDETESAARTVDDRESPGMDATGDAVTEE